MATKAKDSNNAPKKEKKVTPSSNSHRTTHKQANSKSATATDKDKSSPSSNSVPNYLKPTFSSRSESLNPVRKTINEDAALKLLRRRSFDRPPSAARTQKSLISPGPKERLASRDRQTAIRSSSFSASRTSSPTNPVLERNSRSFKPVKSQPAAGGTIKRSSSLSKSSNLSKNGSNASRFLKVQNNHDSTQTSDPEKKQKRYAESSVQDHVETTNVESEVQAPSDHTPEDERKEEKDVVQDTQVKGIEDEKVKSPEASTVVSKAVQVEDNESELHENENKHEGGENQRSDNDPEEDIADATKVENDEDGGEEENANEKAACSSEEPVDEKEEEETTDQGNENERSEEVKSKEGEDMVEGVEEEGNQEMAEAMQKQQRGQEKKEAAAAYNDVIEETKNRLLEKRKNKVKALVGAFETVIDYETAGSNK